MPHSTFACVRLTDATGVYPVCLCPESFSDSLRVLSKGQRFLLSALLDGNATELSHWGFPVVVDGLLLLPNHHLAFFSTYRSVPFMP